MNDTAFPSDFTVQNLVIEWPRINVFVNRGSQPEDEKVDHEFVAVDCVLVEEDDEEGETPPTSSDFRYHFRNSDKLDRLANS